jgi:hypothetical protein
MSRPGCCRSWIFLRLLFLTLGLFAIVFGVYGRYQWSFRLMIGCIVCAKNVNA